MTRRPESAGAAASVLVALGLIAAAGQAAPAADASLNQGQPYQVDVYSIDAGGQHAAGGSFALEGSAGQPESNPLGAVAGGQFSVAGGVWPALGTPPTLTDTIHTDGFE